MVTQEITPLDSKDMQIVSLLSVNPDVSQEEIASKVRLSQPAIGMRIKKLKALGILSKQWGLNLQKAGLYLGKVDIAAKSIKDVLKRFERCPFFLNGFITSGRNNLCLLLIGEDLSSLQSMIDHHLRENSAVERVEDCIIISASKKILYLMGYTGEKASAGPCGSSCETCPCYRSGDCLGCPASTSYRGKLWR